MRLCAPVAVDGAPRRSLQAVLDGLSAEQAERRGGNRNTFDYRLCMTPLDGVEILAEPQYVTGRDLSARGVGFVHPEPITEVKVRLSAADPLLDEIGFGDLEIDVLLKWCRFLGTGAYESGGRITRTTAPLF